MAVRSFGRDLRASLFMLDPEAALLNHGSYGAVPRPVHEAHVALLREVERHPDHWFSTKQPALFREACNAVAAFVGVPGSDLTLVENATTAVNTVLRGAPLSSDQGVLITSLTYRACRIAAEVACAARGATLHSLEIRLPVASPEAIVQLYAEFLEAHPDISLVLLDHITSPSAMVMPVPELVALCHGRGARVMVDGAHAPGQLPLDIGQLQPDYYTGNLHKWVFCPRGCALLYVRPELQAEVCPLVASHYHYQGFQESFSMQATRDYTPYCVAPAAMLFLDSLGGLAAVSSYNKGLVDWATSLLCQRWGEKPLPIPASMRAPFLSLVSLPECLGPATTQRRVELVKQLHTQFNVQTCVDIVDGRLWCRISAQVYNSREEYERLAEAMAELIARARQ